MAILSNINDLFRIDSAGAVYFATSAGANLQVLQSVGTGGSPIWVDVDDIIGGPYLPLTGGTLTGNLALTDATNNPSLVISTGSLTVGGATTLNSTLAGTSAVFTSDAGVTVYTTTSQVGAKITFSDEASSRSQKGFITYRHVDTQSYGSANSFIIDGDQATMTILADGKLMYKEGVYLKPATGTGAGTRKDNLWDAAYNDKITGLAVAGTTTKTLTATQQDGGTLTASWTDNDSGGTVTGTGANTQVAFWTGTSVIDGSSNLKWDNTNFRLGIGITPTYALDIYNSTGTTSSNDGTTLQRLWNYVGGDLQQQKTFIDFVFQDGNDNEYPQVRIGAEVGQNGNADTQLKEGSGAFVVYTNNATTSVPGTNSLTERMRVDYAGNVGIGATMPARLLTIEDGAGGGDPTDSRTKLYINGSAEAYMSFNVPANQYMGIRYAIAGTNKAFMEFEDPNNYLRIGTVSADSIVFATTNSTKMVILPGGNVGIGTDSPDAKLMVSGEIVSENSNGGYFVSTRVPSSSTRPTLNFYGSALDINYVTNYAGSGASTAMSILNGGNVGIGDTSPQGKLEVSQDMSNGAASAFTSPHLRLSALSTTDSTGFVGMTFATSSANNYGFSWGALRTVSALGGMHLRYHGNSASGTDIFNIDYTGNVTIASTRYIRSDSSGGYLTIQGGATYPGGRIDMYGGSSASAGIELLTGGATTSPTLRLRIDGDTDDSYFTGNLGIGYTAPNAKLHVLGSVILDGYSVSDPDATSRNAYPADQMFTHYTNNGVSIIGGAGGYTGCGLTIGEETGRSTSFNFIRGVSDTNGGGGAAEEFWVNGVGGSYFAGDMGIGTDSPSAKLHVKSTANADVIFKLENTNTGTSAGAKIELIDDEGGSGSGAGALRHSISSISQTVGNWIIGSGAAAGQLQFSTVDAFAMMIDEEQNVLIGTTTVTSVSKLQLTSSNAYYGFVDRAQVSGNGSPAGFFNSAGSLVGSISTNNTSTTYITSSDYRLKEDLQDFAGLDMVSKIPVYDFKWKVDESRSYGVMAHELQKFLPDAVSGEKDAEEMQGVDYSKIVPLLVKSIQELEAKIKELENK